MPKRKTAQIVIRADPTFEKLSKVWSVPRMDEIDHSAQAAAAEVKRNLNKTTPVRTGRLLRSQRLKRRKSRSRTRWTITENVKPPYGLFLREGVPPRKINPILPRKKKALFWPGARHPVAAVYKHPGIKKNDYWQKALDMSRPRIIRESEKVGTEIEAGIDI